jgi:Ca2+-binding EF-hand superfamily protein
MALRCHWYEPKEYAMKHRHTLLAAALLAATATVAFAASDAPAPDEARAQRMQEHADKMFSETDSNHDGKISQSEWQSARLREATEKFNKLDTNRDGKLSREEIAAGREQRMGHRGAGMREKLRGLDTDGDQQLSRAEIGDQLPKLAENFDRLDANADGKLSRDEIRAGHEQRGDDATR